MGQLFNKSANSLCFIKSLNIQAYPCSRRRSTLVDADKNDMTVEDRYYIPFDPEARLNTESNNRKYTGINGYAKSYLQEFDPIGTASISLVLDGYLFNINADALEQEQIILENFITGDLATKINLLGKDKIYANIRLEEIQLYVDDNLDYKTWILRDQTQTDLPSTSLDCFTHAQDASVDNPADYYFSGLSFSTEPLTNDSINTVSEDFTTYKGLDGKRHKQKIVSLCIFEKDGNDTWQVHQPALLPNIKHGTQPDSVVLAGDVASTSIHTGTIDATGAIDCTSTIKSGKGLFFGEHPAAMLDVYEAPDNSGDYILSFSSTT